MEVAHGRQNTSAKSVGRDCRNGGFLRLLRSAGVSMKQPNGGKDTNGGVEALWLYSIQIGSGL